VGDENPAKMRNPEQRFGRPEIRDGGFQVERGEEKELGLPVPTLLLGKKAKKE